MLQTSDFSSDFMSLRFVFDDDIKLYKLGQRTTFGDVAERLRGISTEGCWRPRDISVTLAAQPNAKWMQFKAKQLLLDQSECSQFVHVVEEGTVRLQRTFSDGRRFLARFAFPGDAIGLWAESDSKYSAEALGQVTTCRIPRVALLEFLDSRPDLRDRLQKDAERELTAVHDRLIMLARYTAREKVAAFLVQMRDRWFALNGKCVCVPLPMSRQDIGDFLGVTIETVSRMISNFAREKILVVVPDGVRVIDLKRLQAIGLTLKNP